MLAIWESQTVHRPSLVLSCSSWLDNPPDSSHHSSPESVEMVITWKLDNLMPKITLNFWAKYCFTKLQRTQKGIRLSKRKYVEQVVFAKNTSSSSLFRPNILNLRERYYWNSGQNKFERVERVIEQHQKDLRGCPVGQYLLKPSTEVWDRGVLQIVRCLASIVAVVFHSSAKESEFSEPTQKKQW